MGSRENTVGLRAAVVALALTVALTLAPAVAHAAAGATRSDQAGASRMTSGRLAAAPTGRGERFKVFGPTSARPQVTNPFALAADVNSLIPDFKVEFGYNIIGGRIVNTPTGQTIIGGKLQLTALYLFPFFTGFEFGPYGGCTKCAGHGSFARAVIKKTQFSPHTYFDKVIGKRIMTKRTRIAEAVVSPDHIGRFRVYGLNTNPAHPHPVELATGCTPANLNLSSNVVLFGLQELPTVPCKQPVPPGSLSINTPIELSGTTRLQASITGHAGGTQWLIIFQTNKIYAPGHPCGPDALAEELRAGKNSLSGQVRGAFDIGFQTGAQTKPGYFCAYLQVGGRVTVADGAKLPSGRVSATAVRPFYAGDSMSISGATSASPGQQVSETVSGTASIRAVLYVFAPNSPCAGSAQAEFALDPHDLAVAKGPGAYSYGVAITIAAQPPPTVYVCTYLQNGAPADGVPTGLTIRAASQPISIVGAAADPGGSAFGRLSPVRLRVR